MIANKYRKMFSFLLSVLPFVVMMTPLQENIMIVIAYYKMIITYNDYFLNGNLSEGLTKEVTYYIVVLNWTTIFWMVEMSEKNAGKSG